MIWKWKHTWGANVGSAAQMMYDVMKMGIMILSPNRQREVAFSWFLSFLSNNPKGSTDSKQKGECCSALPEVPWWLLLPASLSSMGQGLPALPYLMWSETGKHPPHCILNPTFNVQIPKQPPGKRWRLLTGSQDIQRRGKKPSARSGRWQIWTQHNVFNHTPCKSLSAETVPGSEEPWLGPPGSIQRQQPCRTSRATQ